MSPAFQVRISLDKDQKLNQREETETNQREILKIIGNLSSKTDSLTGKNGMDENAEIIDIENIPSPSGSREPGNMTQVERHYTKH